MAKSDKSYHLNSKTGRVSLCEATIKDCPLGSANHFETENDARNAYENSMNEAVFNGLKKNDKNRAVQLKSIRTHISTLTNKLEKLNEDIKDREKNEKAFSGSEEWYALVQDRKNTAYDIELSKLEEQEIMNDSEREEFSKDANKVSFEQHSKNILQSGTTGDNLTIYHFDGKYTNFLTGKVSSTNDQKMILQDSEGNNHTVEFKNIITSRIQKPSNKPYNYHPDIEGKIHTKNANAVLQSAYGLDEKTINEEIKKRKDEGMNQTEAYRDLWKNSEFRNDKSFVALDLETAGIRTQQVDTGAYSTIIEVGYVKLDDDNISHSSELYGVPDNLLKSHGTGAENIHGISPEMVEGKNTFIENKDAQKKVLDDLKGNVLIAHNARFEIQQLSHNLPGFKKAYDKGEIEVLDTRAVSQYFLPDAETNTNESFVKATGGEYHNAHRAYSDAVMSLNALRRMKNLPEIEEQD